MKKLAIASLPANDSPECLPLGAACVAAAINGAESLRGRVEAFVLEGAAGEGAAELASRIASSGADWAAFSVYSWSREAACGAARALRASRPSALLFAGGPEATADPAGLLAEGGFDFAVAGEGETASVRALEAVLGALRDGADPAGRLGALAGIALPGRPWTRAPAEDPACLPSPWLAGTIAPEGRGGDLVWELARGCPYRCAYCYESKGERGVRYLPMERIEAELALFVESGARYVFVLDPTFNADRGRCLALLDLMRSRAPGLRWKMEVRAELLDGATVSRLARLDCFVQVGLQSARPGTMEALGRGFDREAFARGLGMLDRAGLRFGIDLIYGLPGDALRDFEESLDWALGFGPNHLDVFPLAVLPGTALADRAAELGVEAAEGPPYLVSATREMPAPELARAAELAAACDRFYTAGRAVGWFRAALAPLRTRPSLFLRRYAARRGAASAPASHAAIEAEQLAFLESEYRAAGKMELFGALRDLVRIHGALSRAVAEGEETELELGYDAEELLAAAPASLARFAREAARRRQAIRVAPDGEGGATFAPVSASERGRPGRSPREDRGGDRKRPPEPPRRDRASRR